MATYYIDPDVTAGGAGTIGDPFKLWSEVSWVRGNTYLQKVNTTANENVIFTSVTGTATEWITCSTYGGSGYATINRGSAGEVFFTNGLDYVDVSNFIFTGDTSTGGSVSAVRFDIGDHIRVTNCIARDNGAIGFRFGGGQSDVIVTNCSAIGNGASGFNMAAGGTDILFDSCVADGNGGSANGHGFSSSSHRTSYTSGWTLDAGNVYRRTLEPWAATWPYVAVINRSATPDFNLTENTGTPTTPGANGWGVSGGNVYVDLGGTDPNTLDMAVTAKDITNFVLKDCIAKNTIDFTTTGAEGHGFASDDNGINTTYLRCLAYQNEGYGFNNNRSYDNTFVSCIAYTDVAPSTSAGFHSNDSSGIVWHHCVTAKNPGKGFHTDNSLSATNSAVNCISINCGTWGFLGGSVYALSKSNCCSYNNGNADTFITDDGGNITSNPLLDSNYKPTVNSPCIGAGKIIFGARDYRGRRFKFPPNIGAYSSTSGDVAQTRTAAATIHGQWVAYADTGTSYLSTYGTPTAPDSTVSDLSAFTTAVTVTGGKTKLTANITLTADLTVLANSTIWSENGSQIDCGAYRLILQDSTSVYGIAFTGTNKCLDLSTTPTTNNIVVACNTFDNANIGVNLPSVAGAGEHGPVTIEHNRADGHGRLLYSIRCNNITVQNNWLTNGTNRNIEIKGGDSHIVSGNYIDSGITGINFLLNSGFANRSINNPIVENNYIANCTEEGISTDLTGSSSATIAVVDTFTVNSKSGAYNSSPTINVNRIEVRSGTYYMQWATGTNAGRAYLISSQTDLGATIDITFPNDAMSSDEFDNIAANDDVVMAYIVNKPVIRSNVVIVPNLSQATGITLHGSTYKAHIYNNLVIDPNPSDGTDPEVESRCAIRITSLAGLLAEDDPNNNTTAGTQMSPVGYSNIHDNYVTGIIRSVGYDYTGTSPVLTKDPNYKNAVYNNHAIIEATKWRNVNAIPYVYAGVEPDDISTWGGNTGEDCNMSVNSTRVPAITRTART